ncbi:MAG: diguanylate cyclase [Eggerthellaceae bacterium]|nr:diguanylate cyclase [Eggerthellaceae bacterium]
MLVKRRRVVAWLVLAVLMAVAVFVVARDVPANSSAARLSVENVVCLNDRWEQTSGDSYAFEIPESLDAHPLVLLMKTYAGNFSVLLDDEVLYVHAADAGERTYCVVDVPANSAGKTLTLELPAEDSLGGGTSSSQLGAAYLGEGNGVYLTLVRDNLYAAVFFVLSFLVAVAVAVTVARMRETRRAASEYGFAHAIGVARGGLLDLSLFILVAGVWVLTDSDLLLLVGGYEEAIALVSFTSFMVMPAFLLRFVMNLFDENALLNRLSWLFVLVAAVYLVNEMLGAVPGYVILPFAHVLCVCSIVSIIVLGAKNLRTESTRTARSVMIGFLCLGVFVAVALAMFWRNPLSPYACAYCIGLALLAIGLLDAGLSNLYRRVRDGANAEAYKQLAYLDGLTNLRNRMAFIAAQDELADERDLACVVLDVNDLKQINDQLGHLGGDKAIVAAARCMQDVFDDVGSCYRIGGDEFAVLLPNREKTDVCALVEELKRCVCDVRQSGEVCLDVAVGHAMRREGESVEQMVHRADERMYEAKRVMKSRA